MGAPHELPLFTAEDVFERGPAEMAGPDVLVGNSATASNNHADAFALLAGCTGGARVVVPLSYGNADYGAQVAALGARLFGDRFDALREWMPIDAYNERIRNCGFVVMNHRRQQAVGNIGAALFKGATVYLRREIELTRPRVILAMGRFAACSLLAQDNPQVLTLPFGQLRGQVFRYLEIPVVVTYHPAKLLRAPQGKADAWADLCLARSLVRQPD